MKISTKKLFTSLKNSPRRKFKINHKPKLSLACTTKNNTSKNIKQNLFPKQNNPNKINPFSINELPAHRLRNKNIKQFKSSKNQDLHLKTVNANNIYNDSDDSYNNNNLLTSESDSNKHIPENENKFLSRENGENGENQPERDAIDNLRKLLKQTNLKGAIIIDEKGNNNLNVEQKNIINDYFDKKGKNESKINLIRVQKYKNNKNIFEHKISNTKTFSKLSCKNIKQNININFNIGLNNNNNNNTKKDRIIVTKKLLSTKEKKNEILNLNESLIKNEKEHKDVDNINNSIFENCTNRSFDSSFLGSSMDEVFAGFNRK
jgi:hypothetical protein